MAPTERRSETTVSSGLATSFLTVLECEHRKYEAWKAEESDAYVARLEGLYSDSSVPFD